MIGLVDKQKIIMKHRSGESNRQIATDLGIDKNTVNKYVSQFDSELQSHIAGGADKDTVPQSFMETPRYDVQHRGPKTSTKEAEKIIRQCLDENEEKKIQADTRCR